MNFKWGKLPTFFCLQLTRKRVSTCLVVGLAAVFIFGSAGCGDRSEEEQATAEAPREAPQAVRVIAAEESSIARTLDYVGTARPVREAQVVARLAATAVEVNADEGDLVSRDTVLLRMEAPELEASLQRLDAEVERARREHQYLCDTFETHRQLAEAGVGTQATADASESRCVTSEQALAAARAARDEVRQRRSFLEESPPFEGIVLERMIEPGEHVVPGRPLFLVGTSELDLRVSVTESDVVAGVDLGQTAILSAGGEKWRSEVTKVAPMAGGPGRTIEVRVGLPDGLAELLRAGMSVDVSFVLEESLQTTTVDARAVHHGPQGPVVFVVDDGRLKETPVQLGVQTEERLEILSPLSRELPLVTGRLDSLRDGQEVYPVDVGGMK